MTAENVVKPIYIRKFANKIVSCFQKFVNGLISHSLRGEVQDGASYHLPGRGNLSCVGAQSRAHHAEKRLARCQVCRPRLLSTSSEPPRRRNDETSTE